MKKLFALLSLTAFLAFSVNAQTTQTAPEAKKETSVKAEKKATPGCCMKANTSCCKNNKGAEAKACTPEQKAACAKAGKECKGHDHAKAAEENKESKSGSN